jgi:(p)ppGpp synthase/HD superfamily hydrolase
MKTKPSSAVQLTGRFEQALLYATQKHSSQVKKGTGVPYISHLLGVASLTLDAGADEDVAIAALLHDVVEDCGGIERLDEIRNRFGERVARIVDGCTDTYADPKPAWRKRKEDYIEHLRTADADTRLVSAADKLHNSRAILADYREIGEAVFERFSGKRDGTLWYYRALVNEFRKHPPNRLVDELEWVVDELERVAGVNPPGTPGSPPPKKKP